jgi:hypothetical protein
MRALGVMVIAVLALTGCASSPPVQLTRDAEYDSVEALRDAYTAAGGKCDNWVQDDVVRGSTESGRCGSEGQGGMLSIYPTTASRDSIVKGAKRFEHNFLIGPNWIINDDNVEKLRTQLGGTIDVGR